MTIAFTCPEIQSVSPLYLANLLAAISTDRVTDGPMMLYDKDRRVFLTLSLASGVIIGWVMTSCATVEDAEKEVAQTQLIAELLAQAASQPSVPPTIN